MFVAMGVGAYQVGMFHLFTHAFFKALLFLGAGSVIHAVSGEQDMRKMGGLRKHIPVTYWMMIIGTLALTGFPLTAGWYSKDAIIESAFVGHNPLAGYGFVMTVVAALMTSFYSWRLIFMTFHGKARAPADVMKHAHELPQVMLVPLYILAAGALLAGLVFHGAFLSEAARRVLEGLGRRRRARHRGDAPRAALGGRDPDGGHADRLRHRGLVLHPRHRPRRGGSPSSTTGSTASSSTSGTSTSSTTSSSSARRSGWAASCGRRATAG